MCKSPTLGIKYVGLDVHKDSITIAIADEGRDGNVRLYGKIRNDLEQMPSGKSLSAKI